MSIVERNYAMSKQKMLTIVKCCRQWRHYVKDAIRLICVIIDHNNLQKFFYNKMLNRREAKWWKKLSKLNVVIKWRFDKSNSTNDLSRKFDYEIEARSALDLSKAQELQKAIILKINEWISKFIKKIENNNILSISRNINFNQNFEARRKEFAIFLSTKIVDKSSQIFENDFVNIIQIENIVSRVQINFFDTNNFDQDLVTTIKTKNHNKLLKMKIFQIQKSNRFKSQFCANESFHF